MVLQQFSENEIVGHNSLVIGYNLIRSEFILNDSSDLGQSYRISFDLFEKLWDLLPQSCPGWPKRFFWIIEKNN